MVWMTENHFLFVGLFDWGNAETQNFFGIRESGQICIGGIPNKKIWYHRTPIR